MQLTHSDIAEIIRLVDQSTLDEFVVEVGDLKVEIRRRGATPSSRNDSADPAASTHPPSTSSSPSAAPPSAPPQPDAPERKGAPAALDAPALREGQVAVRSPMVGTFYRRPAPDQPPYVEVGSEVELDAPLCLVEVMKLYTTIYARTRGHIAWICENDAELVEYDQVLFIIDAA